MATATLLAAIAIGCAGAPRGAAAVDDAELARLLTGQVQALVDAVTAGDAKAWDRLVDPELIYLAEDGTRQTKASMLAQIQPLPAGITGKITVVSPQLRRHGDTAILTFDLHEQVNYFGHPLDVTYRETDTWRRGADGWRLIAAQVHAALSDPPSIALPAERLDDYVGVYTLAPDITYTIGRDGDTLTGQRSGRDAETLKVEAPDVLFVAGQFRIRKVFARDAAGKVSGFVDRREARDVPWVRAR